MCVLPEQVMPRVNYWFAHKPYTTQCIYQTIAYIVHYQSQIDIKFIPSLQRGLLALLKYPFYPLFILDNGMNLISKSLTILTPV